MCDRTCTMSTVLGIRVCVRLHRRLRFDIGSILGGCFGAVVWASTGLSSCFSRREWVCVYARAVSRVFRVSGSVLSAMRMQRGVVEVVDCRNAVEL